MITRISIKEDEMTKIDELINDLIRDARDYGISLKSGSGVIGAAHECRISQRKLRNELDRRDEIVSRLKELLGDLIKDRLEEEAILFGNMSFKKRYLNMMKELDENGSTGTVDPSFWELKEKIGNS